MSKYQKECWELPAMYKGPFALGDNDKVDFQQQIRFHSHSATFFVCFAPHTILEKHVDLCSWPTLCFWSFHIIKQCEGQENSCISSFSMQADIFYTTKSSRSTMKCGGSRGQGLIDAPKLSATPARSGRGRGDHQYQYPVYGVHPDWSTTNNVDSSQHKYEECSPMHFFTYLLTSNMR